MFVGAMNRCGEDTCVSCCDSPKESASVPRRDRPPLVSVRLGVHWVQPGLRHVEC